MVMPGKTDTVSTTALNAGWIGSSANIPLTYTFSHKNAFAFYEKKRVLIFRMLAHTESAAMLKIVFIIISFSQDI